MPMYDDENKPWGKAEIEKLTQAVGVYGEDWTFISEKVFLNLRSGLAIAEKWTRIRSKLGVKESNVKKKIKLENGEAKVRITDSQKIGQIKNIISDKTFHTPSKKEDISLIPPNQYFSGSTISSQSDSEQESSYQRKSPVPVKQVSVRSKTKNSWTIEEEDLLVEAVKLHGTSWKYISENYFNSQRKPNTCSNRYRQIHSRYDNPSISPCERTKGLKNQNVIRSPTDQKLDETEDTMTGSSISTISEFSPSWDQEMSFSLSLSQDQEISLSMVNEINSWVDMEDEALQTAVLLYGDKDWDKIKNILPHRKQVELVARWIILKEKYRLILPTDFNSEPKITVPFTEEEENILSLGVAFDGFKNWHKIAQKLPRRSLSDMIIQWNILTQRKRDRDAYKKMQDEQEEPQFLQSNDNKTYDNADPWGINIDEIDYSKALSPAGEWDRYMKRIAELHPNDAMDINNSFQFDGYT
ncbi:4390_t:CDS:2 [Dentiscutata erythropus]|uniref:4390_t:CDS:1 n=1 Tax=Dentiscutata erythropus TaxID=1348616 RepID=A0A9N9DM82_9GLOM|nr:4390_t:CDS:2 [Dentiscutata erythropus]